MKRRMIETGILAAVFIAAVILFSYMTNRGNADMTADIGSASLPGVSFSYEGYRVNPLIGYTEEMDITTMRDTITPAAGQQLQMNIETYENEISAVKYALYTIDGKEKLSESTVENPGGEVALTFDGSLLSEERVLVITLSVLEEEIYYYTRVADPAAFNLPSCMEYVYQFHENALAKAETGIGTAIEPSSEGDNTTFQHVTIHSDFDHVTWGELTPTVLGEERWNIVETNAAYTSVRLDYEVSCTGEENITDTYRVEEFFRVRLAGGRIYLLDYDRTMEQIFDGSKRVLSAKGILLGIASNDIPYMTNEDGTIVSFVQADELWNYNLNTDELSLLFSFRDAENTDVRNLTDEHEVELLSMDEDGNTTFAVYGYMNRGKHEGQVGVAVYYHNITANSIDEKAFIPSNKSAAITMEELGKLVYYNVSRECLHMLADGVLYEIDMESADTKKHVEGLEDGQYVVSKDGGLVAYQSNGDIDEATQVIVEDLEREEEFAVDAAADECIRPLGFVNGDVVTGTARTSDIGRTISGETVMPMYKVEIRNTEGKVVKTYETGGDYVLDVEIEDGMITLNRVVKGGNIYTSISPEHIKSNEEEKESNIFLESYATELKETQMRLSFVDGIEDQDAKLLKPKQTLSENIDMDVFSSGHLSGRYYVYGFGRLQGIYRNAGDAILAADEARGVVVSSEQKYVWERGNRYQGYLISGKDELIHALWQQLAAGKAAVEAIEELTGKSAVDMSGCTTEEMLYLVNKGTPVIGMVNAGDAVILIGYDTEFVTYIDVKAGIQTAVFYEQMDEMLAGTGRTFIGYIE